MGVINVSFFYFDLEYVFVFLLKICQTGITIQNEVKVDVQSSTLAA